MPSPLLLILLDDDDVLGVLRVQDDSDEARLVLLAGVPTDAVQAAGRLVEGVTGLEDLGLVVVDGPLVLALQDVPERRAGVTVRRLHLARRQRHLDHRGLRLLPVQLLDDVLLGEQLDVRPAFAVLAVLCQTHPAGGESAHDDRQQGKSHDNSSERTEASDPSGNKDVEGGTVCDRLEEHSRKCGALRGGGARGGSSAAATRTGGCKPNCGTAPVRPTYTGTALPPIFFGHIDEWHVVLANGT